jgi:transposase-like protein
VSRRNRRKFEPDFKAEAVRLVLEEGRTINAVAKSLDIYPSSLSDWVRQAEIDRGKGPPGALKSEELDELRRLRKENRELKMEREILKKAAAFFAKENS